MTQIFIVVLYQAPLPTFHFCVSSYNNNFVEIGKPLLMIRFHAFICSRKRKVTMHTIAKHFLYLTFVSMFKKKECTYGIMAISHKPKRQSNIPLKTHSVHYFLVAFSCLSIILKYMSLVMRKPDFCLCENKDADQLRGNLEADQCLCFCYTDSTIPLLLTTKLQASNRVL